MSKPNWDISVAAPPTLSHVIGNQRVVEQIKVTLEACFADGAPFPHTLFLGEKGCGKSLLATIVAKECGAELVEMIGQTVQCFGDLTRVLLQLDEGGVLFIDEIHTLARPAQVTLLRAVEEGRVYLEPTDLRPKPRRIKLPKFTLLAATTDPQNIVGPLRDRFKLTCHLEALLPEEMTELLRQRATALHWRVENEVLSLVALRSRGVPRLGIRLMESVYRVSRAEGCADIQFAHAIRAFELEGLQGSTGISTAEAIYLSTLSECGGQDTPVRLNVIAARLGNTDGMLADTIEPYLVREGLIVKTPQGRLLTEKGLEVLRSCQS